MLRIISLSLILVFIAGCSGQSTAELRRLQMLEAQRAEEAAREAQSSPLNATLEFKLVLTTHTTRGKMIVI